MKRLLSALPVLIAGMAAFVVCAYAGSRANGISLSAQRLYHGKEFTVTLYAPPSQNADTVSVRVDFDSSAFEVTEWKVSLPGTYASSSGEGYFAASSANAERAVDMSGGVELRAALKVKDTAEYGRYEFRLSESSICYFDESAYDYVELWEPEVKSVSVNVFSEPADITGQKEPAGNSGNEPENSAIKIIIIAAAALLFAVLCFAAVRFGIGRKK